MTESKDSKRVAKAVIYIDGKILLLKNQQGWDLPGGHVKKEESTIEGLVREIEEETGIKLSKESISGPVYRHNHMQVYETHMSIASITLSDEHDSYKLIHPENISNIKLSKRFLKAIKKTFE